MYLEDSVAQIEKFEGRVPWMYLDSTGNVTVGVGFILPNLQAALELPFKVGDVSAEPQQITDDYLRVSAMTPDRIPSFYRGPTSPTLDDAYIGALLLTKVASLDASLPSLYRMYRSWPDPAKLAILDMDFNLGLGKLKNQYPRMNQYLDATPPNFLSASFQCGRNTSDPSFNSRNEWTRRKFVEAASL